MVGFIAPNTFTQLWTKCMCPQKPRRAWKPSVRITGVVSEIKMGTSQALVYSVTARFSYRFLLYSVRTRTSARIPMLLRDRNLATLKCSIWLRSSRKWCWVPEGTRHAHKHQHPNRKITPRASRARYSSSDTESFRLQSYCIWSLDAAYAGCGWRTAGFCS
jgi:hypothetical protein